MKTIRGRLFVSMGAILLLASALNYFLPKYFINQDMDYAAEVLLKKFSTPSSEQDISGFMHRVGQALENKISIILLTTSFFGLVAALLLLSHLSKRITKPIGQLKEAALAIGEGHYENISLPEVKKSHDELALFVHSFENMAMALADREKVHGVLNKVVSADVASEILKGKIELGGEERVVTLLFSDIRSFTHISNQLGPQEVIEMLNEYMTLLCHIIDQTQGVVDKFVGDEIIALYGAPLSLSHHADHALTAAIEMRRALEGWNEQRKRENKIPLTMGMGIHTGVVCAGNMGALNRLNYTVIGANVNLASRLCSAAKPMQILLSSDTEQALTEIYPLKALAPIQLKGFDNPINLFEI